MRFRSCRFFIFFLIAAFFSFFSLEFFSTDSLYGQDKVRVVKSKDANPDGSVVMRVVGEAWSTEAGATVLVFNDRIGVTKSVTTGSDGSFTLELEARSDDLLFITVMDAAGNKTVVETPPFTSADGKTVVLDSRSREYVTPEGFGVRLEPGTFAHAVPVRLARVTDPATLTPLPTGYSRLQAVNLDFSGERPLKSLKLSMPAPAGLPAGAQLLVARQVSVFGQQRLMVMDTCALVGDRVETNSPPFPGVDADGLYAFIYNASYMLSYVSLPSLSASCALVSDDFVFISDSWSTTCTLPFRIDETASLKVYDTVTGEKLWEGEKKAPGTAGQTYAYTDVKNESDKALPYPVSVSGFTLYAFNLSSVEASAGLITATATDANDDHVPEEGTVTVTGKEKALPELREGLPPWSVRLYNFRLPAAPGAQGTLSAADPVDSDMKGAFSTAITASLGDRLLLVPEKGEVPLSTSWTFTFSEPLDAASVSKDTIKLVKIVEGNRLTVEAEVKMAETDSGSTLDNKFLLKPKAVLDAGRRYEIVLEGIRDRAGNSTTSLILPFRTIQPQNLGYDATPEVYGSLRLGTFLYVAAGSAGLRVLDVSNPARPTLKGELRAATLGRVRGVARFGSTGSRLAIVGGGDQVYGYVKIVDVSNPAAPSEVSSLAISIPIGQTPPPSMQRYVFGQPRDVEVVGNTAFVSLFGGGLVTVDLSRMSTDEYDNRCIVGLFPEEFIVGVKPLRTTDGSGNVTVQHLAIAVDYLGIKIIDTTSTFYPRFADTPEERQVKAGRVTVGLWQLPWREHLSGLEVAMDVPYDVDNDGKVAEGEVKDLLFVAAATRATLFTLDVDNPASPAYFGEVALRDREGNESLLVGEILYCRELSALFLTDRNLGLVRISTRNLAGARLDADGDKVDDRILAIVATRGAADFGLAIDPFLNVAYVGEEGTGVEGIKIGQPLIRIVEAKEETPGGSDTLKSVEGLYPAGFEASHNVYGHPSTFRVAASLPGVLGDTVEAEVTSLGSQFYPLVRWTPTTDTAKNTVVKVTLHRQGIESDRNNDHYNLFISDPVLALAKPEAEDGDNPHNAAAFLFSGDWVRATLSRDGIAKVQAVAGMSDYLDTGDLSLAADLKRSLPIELAMPEKPAPRQNPSIGSGEVSHSGPGLGGSSFSSVFLHSGELFLAETDLAIPGRGLDTAFTRRYQSQAVYSGPLGFGWDHGLNRRLVELPDGTVFYYDGSGRRDEFKPKRTASGEISDFDSPAGLFAELKKRIDGTYVLRYADGTFERYDPFGRLQGIQDRFENKVECDYNLAGQLGTIIDTMGRVTVFDYYPMEETLDGSRVSMKTGRVQRLIDFKGGFVEYDYDDKGDLTKAQKGERKKDYRYETVANDVRKSHNLIEVYDGKGQKYLEVAHTDDRVVSQKIGGSTIAVASGTNATTTDGNGHVRQYQHAASGQAASVTEGGHATAFTHNAEGQVTSVVYPRGNSVLYTYQGGDLPRSKGNLLAITERGDGDRLTTFSYDSEYNQVTASSMPSGLQVVNQLGDKGQVTSVTTNAGLSYAYTYNKFGQVTSESDSNGSQTTYEYHPESAPGGTKTEAIGRPTDPATGGYLKRASSIDRQANYQAYDAAGNLTQYSDSTGSSTTLQYNDHGEVVSESSTSSAPSFSPLGYQASYTRDANGNVASGTETWGGGSRSYTILYNLRNDPNQVSDSRQGTTSYTYDGMGNATSISSPSGLVNFEYNDRSLIRLVSQGTGDEQGTTTYDYDPNGNMTSVTDPRGKATVMEYDGFDRTRKMTDAAGSSTEINRNVAGTDVVVLYKNPAGESQSETHTTYDLLGRVQTQTRKLFEVGGDVSFTYTYAVISGGGQQTVVTDPLGNQATTAKDPAGRVVSESDFAGNQVNYYYEDGRGNLTKQVERDKKPDGTYVERTTLYVYNGLGSVEKTIENSGTPQEKTTTFLYDGEGKLTASLEGENRKLEHTYDASGRRNATFRFLDNGERAETHYTYVGTTSLVRTIQDGNGNATTFDYDSRNRLKTTVYPDGTTQEFTYDAAGNVLTEKQRSGTVVTNAFDDLGRLTHRAVQRASGVLGDTFEDYGYDSQSRLTRGETDGSLVEFGYDSMGRRTWEKQNGKTVSYAYDVLSNLKSITYPNGRIVEREHDLMGQIKKISIGGVPIATFDFSGRRLTGKTYGNGDVTTYTYDLPGYRPIAIEAKNKNDAIISHFAYGYDLYTLKTHEKRLHDGGKGDSYTYDALNRIKSVKVNSTQPENPNNATFEVNKDYAIDKVDNLLKITENRDNVLTEILAERDANSTKLNQYTSFNGKVMAYDANGNLSTKGNQTFAYDFKNRLVKVDQPENVIEYGYDVFGRQIEKKINSSINKYYYAGVQKIEERDASDSVTRQLIYGNGIDEIVRTDKYVTGTPESFYFHLNEIGSVTSITDSNGSLVERINYDTFGKPTFTDFKTDPQNPTNKTNSVIGNDILFQGREYDYDLTLYNYRTRYYDPETGRYIQGDPLGYEDSINLYQSMFLNTQNYLDPIGTKIVFQGANFNESYEKVIDAFSIVLGYSINEKDSLRALLPLLKDNSGNYYMGIVGDSGVLFEKSKNRIDYSKIPGFYYFLDKYAYLLKSDRQYKGIWNTKDMQNQERRKTLEDMLEYIIRDEGIVEFKLGSEVKEKKRKKIITTPLGFFNKYGYGVCLEPHESLNGNIEITVNPEIDNPYDGIRPNVGINLEMDLPLTIIHEFGHAYANLQSFISEENDPDTMHSYFSLVFENLYRIKAKYQYLRAKHINNSPAIAIGGK